MSSKFPLVKSPSAFTGEGEEIIGKPNSNSDGTLHFRNGKFREMCCVEPSIGADEAKKLIPTLAQQIAQFNLRRLRRSIGSPAEVDELEEEDDKQEAGHYAQKIASHLLNGQFLRLAKRIERAVEALDEAEIREASDFNVLDGFWKALHQVSRACTHPDQVTVSAVGDYLESNIKFCISHGITESMRAPREVRKRMIKLGFDWLPQGRGKGRPKGDKDVK